MMIAWRCHVSVQITTSSHKMMIAWRCLCPTHEMMIAWRYVFQTQLYPSQTKIWRSDKHFRVRFPGKHFSTLCSQNRHPWKVLPGETHSEMFVRPSNLRLGRINVESRDDDSMTMRMSKSQLRVIMMIAWRCVCPTHKMMIAWRCVFPNQNFTSPKRIFWKGEQNFSEGVCEALSCSPNEDFGRMNKRGNPDFRLTFQWFVAQIEYSRPWKVLRQCALKGLFGFPKYLFGRCKLRVRMIIAYDSHHQLMLVSRPC